MVCADKYFEELNHRVVMYKQKLSFRDRLAKNYINAVGWRTNRKMVLIESDDWGTIRMASRHSFEALLS